jgi:hypothetical protein
VIFVPFFFMLAVTIWLRRRKFTSNLRLNNSA